MKTSQLLSLAALGIVTVSSVAYAASSKSDVAEYTAEISSGGDCKQNAACTLKVTVTAKGSYHVNQTYPYSFKLAAAPAGVTYAKATLDKTDAAFEEKKATFTVSFTPANTGKTTIEGKLRLGVCKDSECIDGKIDLGIDVDVKAP